MILHFLYSKLWNVCNYIDVLKYKIFWLQRWLLFLKKRLIVYNTFTLKKKQTKFNFFFYMKVVLTVLQQYNKRKQIYHGYQNDRVYQWGYTTIYYF